MPISHDSPNATGYGGNGFALEFATAAFTTTGGTMADVTGSDFNAAPYDRITITVQNTGANGATYQVLGGHNADFSDASAVRAATTLAAGLSDNFTPPAFSNLKYFKVQAKDTITGSHATVVVNVRCAQR